MKRYKLYIFDWHGTLMKPEFGIKPANESIEHFLFSNVLETLQSLKKQGCLLAIATTMPSATIQQYIESKELHGLFDTYRCADQTASKPNPLMIDEILQELAIEPEEAVMVGDSVGDIQLAKNAGIDMIAAAYGTESPQVLKAYAPHYIITKTSDLLV